MHAIRHVLNCLVQNEPGVLSRVSGILAGRGFNIDSLVVCRTEIRDLSRMCVVLRGQDGVVEQARRQLEDLVSHFARGSFSQSSSRGAFEPRACPYGIGTFLTTACKFIQ